WRNPKAYADELRKLQQPDVVTARTDKRNYTSGEQVRFEALLSHYSHLDLKGAELLWHTETEPAPHRHKIGPSIVSAGSSIVGRHLFTAPDVESPRRERIVLEVLDSMGALAAESSAEVFIYPKTTAMKTDAARVLTLHDPKNSYAEFGGRLSESGYDVRVSRAEPPTGLVLASTLDDFVMEHLRKGGRAVILADSKEALPAAAPVKVVPREGDLDGNWVTNFNWVRVNREPYSAVAINPILGFEGLKTVPRFVIQNVPGAAYADVLAGIFYGWINNNAALSVQMKAGAGKLILTTFRFDAYGRDPYATRLLDAMIRYVNSQNFAPRFDWDAPRVK
ncbi:MAG TPA: hypothetical protein VM095_18330, partial [Pyrinomonadaceae bacterium]|nr:hypothetical protein [Pyrinomonadaceae bacterium]